MKYIMTFIIAILLSSCYSYKPLTSANKEGENTDLFSGVEPNKRYRFGLNDGKTLTIMVTSINHEEISGRTYDYYDKNKRRKTTDPHGISILTRDVANVKGRKFSAGKTTVMVLAPVAMIAGFVAISLDHGGYISGPLNLFGK